MSRLLRSFYLPSLLLFVWSAVPVFAQQVTARPAQTATISMRSGGDAVAEVNLFVPRGQTLTVGGPDTDELSIRSPLEVSLHNANGFAIELAEDNAKELEGKGGSVPAGSVRLHLFETEGRDVGPRVFPLLVKLNGELCSASGHCSSTQAQVSLRVSVAEERQSVNFRSSSDIDWVLAYSAAMSQARSSGKNVFVVITAPSWCGYCRLLERDVFSRDSVADMLNNGFVALRILDSNNDRTRFSFDGYPTMLVVDSRGQVKGEIGGRTEQSFLAAVAPYASESDEEVAPRRFNYSRTIRGTFEQTESGWREIVPGGPTVNYTEYRRNDRYIVLRGPEGGYVALPIEGGKALVWRDGEWKPDFDVAAP